MKLQVPVIEVRPAMMSNRHYCQECLAGLEPVPQFDSLMTDQAANGRIDPAEFSSA